MQNNNLDTSNVPRIQLSQIQQANNGQQNQYISEAYVPSKIYHPSTIIKVQNKQKERVKQNISDNKSLKSVVSNQDHSYLSEAIPKKGYLKALTAIKKLTQIYQNDKLEETEKKDLLQQLQNLIQENYETQVQLNTENQTQENADWKNRCEQLQSQIFQNQLSMNILEAEKERLKENEQIYNERLQRAANEIEMYKNIINQLEQDDISRRRTINPVSDNDPFDLQFSQINPMQSQYDSNNFSHVSRYLDGMRKESVLSRNDQPSIMSRMKRQAEQQKPFVGTLAQYLKGNSRNNSQIKQNAQKRYTNFIKEDQDLSSIDKSENEQSMNQSITIRSSIYHPLRKQQTGAKRNQNINNQFQIKNFGNFLFTQNKFKNKYIK